MQVVRLADNYEASDGVPQALFPEVVPEDARGARMSHDIGIALVQMPRGEGPMVERRSCIVIL
jgi:hypothetical protein